MIAKLLALLILFGGLLLIRRRVLVGLGSRTWPCTPGMIVSAGRVFSGHDDSGDSTWNANVTYTYSVDGEKYTGNTLEVLPFVLGDAQVARVIEQYPPGKAVAVYYDPRQPDSSVIVPGLGGLATVMLLAYVGVCIALIVSLFV